MPSAEIQEVSRRLSSVFVRLYLTSAWEPFVAAGMPDVGWTQLTAALRRQRAIWPRAVLPALAHALDQEVDAVARGVAVGEVASTPT